MQELMPSRDIYVVTFTAGPDQSRRRKPTYMLYAAAESSLKDKETVPSSVAVNKCRSFAYEKLHQRCVDSACFLVAVSLNSYCFWLGRDI